uniref:Uncharacterized protein n=1 Tax=Periophthalmus magnuspinnatus TaxID=409849 RepID=A0A3B3ZN36_9GOBI
DLGGGTALSETPEMDRVKRNQQNISTIQYKEAMGQGTSIPDLPEVKRVKETQKNISLHQYREGVGQGTSVPETPEMERVKRNQHSSHSFFNFIHCIYIYFFVYYKGTVFKYM